MLTSRLRVVQRLPSGMRWNFVPGDFGGCPERPNAMLSAIEMTQTRIGLVLAADSGRSRSRIRPDDDRFLTGGSEW